MIDYKKELFSNAYKKRIPLIATIEIISACNFRCVHCYLGNDVRKDILSFEQVVDFGNQIINLGCLYVVLTGGEVLLHPDFSRIYLFFVKKGVSVSVFTNGSLIDRQILDLFINYPPRVVEITMYGFNPETYINVTKVNQFEKVMNNILLLKKNNINVLLKMFVMLDNYTEFEMIRKFALANSIPFKYDTRIIAPNDSEEKQHQLGIDEACKIEIAQVSTIVKYNEETYRYIVGERKNKLFQCGAGRSSCWLKSNNRLRICNFIDAIEYDLSKYKVAEAWKSISECIEGNVPTGSKCFNCELREYCDYCPGRSYVAFQKTDMLCHDNHYCHGAQIRAFDDYTRVGNKK